LKKQLFDWFELDFRFQRWLHQAWPFGLLGWLLLRRVPRDADFSRFADKRDALHLPVEHLKADVDDGNRTDEHGKCISPYGNTLPSLCRLGDSEIEQITPEQYAVLANAEPKKRGNVVESLLPAEAAEILKAREAQRIERWKTLLAVSAGAAGLVGFLIGLVALFFAR